ncbi:MAG: anthranilate synthase component I family protein [Candidatus Melainabacteria bacterium]
MLTLSLKTYSLLADITSPIALFHKLSPTEPTAFLLESSDGDTRLARFSFIGIDPVETFAYHQGEATITRPGEAPVSRALGNPLTYLRERIAPYREAVTALSGETPIPFLGGWVGYMGYGATSIFDQIPRQTVNPFASGGDDGIPDACYGLYDSLICFDHLERRVTLISLRTQAEADRLWQRLQDVLDHGPSLPRLNVPTGKPELESVFAQTTGPVSKENYCAMVGTAKDWIREGQVFQIVVAHRFETDLRSDGITVYRMMQAINPSPYAYFLKFPGFDYIGSSPETFVSCFQQKATLRALAGTRPRGRNPEEDSALANELRANEKELAEHHMLVDLGRNDMGRMCDVGSIRLGEIGEITRYAHVMHLATEITGTLRADKTCFDVFQSCFPRGTVSGAPKIRAMTLLSQLEPEQRGIYSGVVGYFDFTGNMDAAIAIRSALLKDGKAHVNAGAGVVYDSDPVMEYEETRNKALSILTAIHLANQAGQQSVSNPAAVSGAPR